MSPTRSVLISTLAVLVALTIPVGASAQLGGSSSGWAPVMVGIRFGQQQRTGSWVLGGQARIPILPSGIVEVMPNADITYLTGEKQYQYALDAAWVSGGRHGGLYAGAGLALRRGVFNSSVGRETKKGWDIVVGLKTMPGRGIPVGIQLEERWTFLHLPVNPSVLSLGVNVPLWGWGHFGR
ncbi:MAG: hypothetical protein LJF06_09485 [Gemmatimonadetes bacterium]|nr:hypothetical protein [Gemmatimonadota bacterium]